MYDGSRGIYVPICEGCFSDTEACAECDANSIFVELNYDEDSDLVFCDSCMRDRNRCIHDYSYKPQAIFHTTSGEVIGGRGVVRYNPSLKLEQVPTFGIELETECGDNSARGMAEKWKGLSDGEESFYLKHDGSLDNGIEVVTHPRTLSSWREFCEGSFAETLYTMARAGARSWNTDTAGLHVHVGKNAFTTRAHLARFALLINRNRFESIRFACRESSYANYERGQNIRYYEGNREVIGSRLIAKAKGVMYSDHFDAVNMSGNDCSTIEVRIFKPSLAVGRILAVIEFVAAGVEYTRTMTSGDVMNGALAFSRFATYMSVNGYQCATLANEGQRFTVSNSLSKSISKFSIKTEREDISVCA